MQVDFYASQPHYLDHILPIYGHLPDTCRGELLAHPSVPRAADRYTAGLQPSPNPVVVAGQVDLRKAVRRPVVFVEHGAGQTYNSPNIAYAGGPGRGRVNLFLCPNEQTAAKNQATYPNIPAVVVGSPWLETLHRRRQASSRAGRTVTLSFHFDSRLWPETCYALPHYRDALPQIIAELENAGWRVLGHGHPKGWSEFSRLWRDLGVEAMRDFTDVVEQTDVYVCDNSSTLFEAAALDIPVVLLNAPWFRRDIEFGLRFWEWAGIGPQVDHPSQLVPAIVDTDSDRYTTVRGQMRSDVYHRIEGAAAMAASAIVDKIGLECRQDPGQP